VGEEKFAVFFIIFLYYKAIFLPIFNFEFCGFGEYIILIFDQGIDK